MLLLGIDPIFATHDTGVGHPERSERLVAVADGVARADLGSDLVSLSLRAATRAELERVHPASHLDRLESSCRSGAHLDADTPTSPGSWAAAVLAAGTGLTAVEALRAGPAHGAFLAIRPPGHHARPEQAMGFCLLNNVAITAAALRDAGDRVAIVDVDAHHGNGTQEVFYGDPDVLYVSLHEWPLYPGTGRHDEVGAGAGHGTTCNVPLPAGATGDVYLAAFDRVIAPRLDRFRPDWVLISAGFDAHRDDPLTGIALSAGDYGLLIERLVASVPRGRAVTFLEGGYSLTGLRDSVATMLPVLVGAPVAAPAGEAPTSGGPGARVLDAVEALWAELEP